MAIREMTISDIKDVVPLYVSYYNEQENGRRQEGSGLNMQGKERLCRGIKDTGKGKGKER